jgi:hypothetical protein
LFFGGRFGWEADPGGARFALARNAFWVPFSPPLASVPLVPTASATFRWVLIVLAAATAGLGARTALAQDDTGGPTVRGGRVGWGRLITERSSWSVHSANDPELADFIRNETSLNIDPTCYPVDPSSLVQLCNFPFLFTNNLTNVHNPRSIANLREYLRRGGFIYIDRCVNLSFSLPQETFYARHIDFFAQLLPGSEVRPIAADDPIYRCYFPVDHDAEPLRMNIRQPGHNSLYGVYDRNRMVILLSLANFQCGWPGNWKRQNLCMKMVANIYVYAMTR